MLILPVLLSMAFLSLAAGHAHDAGGTGVPVPGAGMPHAYALAVQPVPAFSGTLTGPGCLLSLSEPYGHKRYVSPVTVAGTPFWGVDIGTCEAVDAGRSAYVTVLVDALDGGDVLFVEGSVCYPNSKRCGQ